MRGTYDIEQEMSYGGRRNFASIDIEGLLARRDALEVAKERAEAALAEPAVFKVRVIHDDGWYRRVHATREACREWRHTRHAPPRTAAKREP